MLAFVALIGLALAACQRGGPEISDPNRISQVQKGSSTKGDIQTLFGKPEAIYHDADGTEMWTYHYHSIPAASVLFGVYAGGQSYATMTVSFDQSGVVTDYHVSGTEGQVKR
jgi:outer membrane protein assembly factor BamE (lipoprotein component of BamABCDE complex)